MDLGRLRRPRGGPRRLPRALFDGMLNPQAIDDGRPKAGEMKLYPRFEPSLAPGRYGIEVRQTIWVSTGSLDVFNYDSVAAPTFPPNPDTTPIVLQEFDVMAPRFELDPKVIHSVYPPEGGSEESAVLPHIVFNDPHVPWERPGPMRLTPWIALVVLTPAELQVDAAEARALGIPDESFEKVTASGAFSMSAGDFLTKITSRVEYEAEFENAVESPEWIDMQASIDKTKIIFPKASQMRQIFDQTIFFGLPHVAHVREVSTAGFPDAAGNETALFSVCISQMSGDTSVRSPTTHVVHLVSTEYLGQLFASDSDISGTHIPQRSNTAARIGIVSLHSWTYLAVPPNPINFKDTMNNLAATKGALRPSTAALDSIPPAPKPPLPDAGAHSKLLKDRLSRGYSLHRWRASTGEETLCFSRGPLTPIKAPWMPDVVRDWPGSSNTGKEYQVLDPDLGVMDMTYSSAWQLGRLMAVSDGVFNSALFRFRSLVHKWASDKTRTLVNGVASMRGALRSLTDNLVDVAAASSIGTAPARNLLPTTEPVAPFLTHPDIRPSFLRAINTAMAAQTASGEKLYNDYDLGSATNSDWEIIHNWISDKLFLSDIPAHYLITDPSHLPPESLRFFHVDDSWLDCFIDGALSVANHLDPIDDTVRKKIKEAYNTYLHTPIAEGTTPKPPTPRYGFLLRSELIRIMPDIRIVARCRKRGLLAGIYFPDTKREPMIRLTRMSDNTIFALLDCEPEDLYDIRFIQPPHQQRYLINSNLKTLYTQGAPRPSEDTGEWPPIPAPRTPTAAQRQLWYNPATRCLSFVMMARDLVDALQFEDSTTSPPQAFHMPVNSAILSLELSDSNYQLSILPPDGTVPRSMPLPDRTIWTGRSFHIPLPLPDLQPLRLVAVSPGLETDDATIDWDNFEKFASRRPNATIPTIHRLQAQRLAPEVSEPLDLHRLPVLPSFPPQVRHRQRLARRDLSSTTSQYRVVVYPAYRSAAASANQDAPDTVYSARDYIPTSTKHVINLIFSIKRLPSSISAQHLLSGITISIPTAAGRPSPPSSPTSQVEPLLKSPYTNGHGARMLSNKRLITFVSASADKLDIKLVPRGSTSQRPSAGLATEYVKDLSFVLVNCEVALIQTPTSVQVIGVSGLETRGVCKIKVSEAYGLPGGDSGVIESEVVVLKKDGGDVDLRGEAL